MGLALRIGIRMVMDMAAVLDIGMAMGTGMRI